MSSSPPTEKRVRASQILRIRKIWLIPLVITAVFVAVMTAIYIGSVINPTGHLHGLPVIVVNEDAGASVQGKKIDIGSEIVGALEGSSAVAHRLKLTNAPLARARAVMNRADAYATLVIPATLSRSVLLSTGTGTKQAGVPSPPSITLLENTRMGTLGVSLAAGVLTPAIAKISPQIGAKLRPLATPPAASNPVMSAQLSDPVALTTSIYRPLPDHTALGLSAFYISLLTIIAGFFGATLINASIDSALGYGPTELGPRWLLRRPVNIDRRHTMIVKACATVVATPAVTGVLLLVAVAALNMNAPHVLLLWGLTALAFLMIAVGTLALFAAFGSIGQLLALILFVYLSLASSGGTIPIEALPGIFAVAAHVEPLRQLLVGARAILYFGAHGDAGLTHSLIVLGCELAFWALIAVAVTSWYDHRRLYRIAPELFAIVTRAIDDVTQEQAASVPAPATAETTAGAELDTADEP